MPWIMTADGTEISLQCPLVGQLRIEHIAHSLAQLNRFTGHTSRPYSVAEHSLLVADIAERHFGLDVHGQMAALMHDAHEAYTQDLSTPAKAEVGNGWRAFEARFAHLVAVRFNCLRAITAYHAEIMAADRMALATERAQLLPHFQPNGFPSTPWPGLANVKPLTEYALVDKGRCDMTWFDWRNAFLDRFHELQFAIAEQAALAPPA